MKRILSFDVLRGLAIMFMLVFHLFFIMYDFSWANKYVQEPSTAPLWVLIAGGLILYLQSWGGLFLFISMSVNSYVMTKKLQSKVNPHVLLSKQEVTGAFLLVIAVFSESFMHFKGFLGLLIINHVYYPQGIIYRLLIIETLHTIALSLLITSFFLYLLSITKLLEDTRKTIILYVTLISGILIISPLLQAHVLRVYPNWPNPQQRFVPELRFATARLIVYAVLIGYPEPLFPYLATGFTGSLIGYLASRPEPPRIMIPSILVSGIFMILWGIYRDMHGYSMSPFIRSNFTWYLLGFGGQLIAIAVFMYFIEFKGHTQKVLHWSTPIRRFGMVSLTIYTFQLWSYTLYYPLQWLLGWPIIGYKSLNLAQALLVLLLTILYWHYCLKLWEKIGFVGSLEWMIRVILARKIAYDTTKGNVKEVLYESEPIVFTRPQKD